MAAVERPGNSGWPQHCDQFHRNRPWTRPQYTHLHCCTARKRAARL